MEFLSKIKQYINELLFGKKTEEPIKKVTKKAVKEKETPNKLKVKKGKKKAKK